MRNRQRPSRNNSNSNARYSSANSNSNWNWDQSPANDANYGSSHWGSGRRDQYDATQFRDPNFGSGRAEYPYDREALNGRGYGQNDRGEANGRNYNNDRSYSEEGSIYPQGFSGNTQGRPSNYSNGGHGQNQGYGASRGRMARGGNSYNDEFDHDYENRPGRSQNEDSWRHQDRNSMSHGQFHGSRPRAGQRYDQPAEENMGYQNMGSSRDQHSDSRYTRSFDRPQDQNLNRDLNRVYDRQGRYPQSMDQDNERFESDSTRRNFRPHSNAEHIQDDWSSQDRYLPSMRSKDRYY